MLRVVRGAVVKFKVKSLKWEEFRRYSRVVTFSDLRFTNYDLRGLWVVEEFGPSYVFGLEN